MAEYFHSGLAAKGLTSSTTRIKYVDPSVAMYQSKSKFVFTLVITAASKELGKSAKHFIKLLK